MAHIGIVCLPVPSHLNLFLVLARMLLSRGHRVTFFGIPEIQARVTAIEAQFQKLEPDTVPPGTINTLMSSMGNTQGVTGMKASNQFDRLRTIGILEKGPAVISHAKPNALVIDQAEAAGGSVAEILGLPWATVCSGLCMNSEPRIPLFFTTWSYAKSDIAVARNHLAYAILRLATRPAQNLINNYRKSWKLEPLQRFSDTFSPYAQICQQIPPFDFPRSELPKFFHYVGPIRQPTAPPCDFPWERLDGRPMIYASLGTLVNQHTHIYKIIAEACSGLNAQLVLSLGGGAEPESYRDLPGTPLVVRFAPQRELLTRAALTITHAGLNTTLESLCEGVPLVAIPIAFEQPGIAARIHWTGTGEFISPSRLNAQKLRLLLEKVLSTPAYHQAAQLMRDALHPVQGSIRAVEIIEKVIATREPVTRVSIEKRKAAM